jgi:hypothetical protein
MSIPSISQEGLPSNLDYQEKLLQIPNEVSSYCVSCAPAGLTVVSGSANTPSATSPFQTNTNGFFNQPFNQQSILFNIQSGHNPYVYLDCKETTISGRIIIAYTSSVATGTNLKMTLIGSASSFFETMVL